VNILQDVKTAIKLTGEVRKARKAGASGVQLRPVYSVPVLKFSYWGGTMEGCLFCGRKWQAIRDVFDIFDEDTQHALTFVPKNGGAWVDRARFWQRELRPALEPKLYHEAMMILLNWYIRCVKMRREGATV